ncbi:oxygen-dependent coproporphyrinogen oxidase [Paracoccaceae bacterium]|nr:oxygen-dependent coproporphyrinogen oxidase [Paracoccaceae bacterium]
MIGELEKSQAEQWFKDLRDKICLEFEQLEIDHLALAPEIEGEPKKFRTKSTTRETGNKSDGGGGIMAFLNNGRVFEKVGVNVSVVYGKLTPEARKSITARKAIPELEEDPRFWASGISLVAHMKNPLTPAVHLNTRMFWTPHAWWFGGGTDLNPSIENKKDTSYFHDTLRKSCNKHDTRYYERFKKWADEYFYIPHRQTARGVGGIFFDDLCTEDWENDFSFTKEIGNAFLKAYVPIVKKHFLKEWSIEQKIIQEKKRGLYAEFNLVYDRGTKFGLQTGHNIEAVLMSLPPTAKWT